MSYHTPSSCSLEPDRPNDLVNETFATGLVGISIELSDQDLVQPAAQLAIPGLPEGRPGTPLTIVVGQRELARGREDEPEVATIFAHAQPAEQRRWCAPSRTPTVRKGGLA